MKNWVMSKNLGHNIQICRVNEQRNILHEKENGRLIGLVTSYVETAF